MFRHNYMRKCCTALLTIALLTGCSLFPAEEETLRPPLVKPAQENYRTVEVKKGTIVKQIRSVGTLESYYSEVAEFTVGGGRVKEVAVRAGDTVKRGDVLIRLDVGDLDIEVKQLLLNLTRSREALRNAKLSGSESDLTIAELQYEIDKMKYDKVNSAFTDKQLVAPMDGQITFVDTLKEGDYVETYKPLVIISDPSKLRIALPTDSMQDTDLVGVGLSADLTISNVALQGTVTQTPSSAPTTSNETLRRRYTSNIFIEAEELPEGAKIGTRVEVQIRLQEREDVLIIPRSALRNYLGRTFVRLLEDGDKIREVDVEVGITGGTEMEIAGGLNEGDLIVLP